MTVTIVGKLQFQHDWGLAYMIKYPNRSPFSIQTKAGTLEHVM